MQSSINLLLKHPNINRESVTLHWRWPQKPLFLMALGSATRVMNAGLACPDWPLCYGELLPRQQMNFQVFLEWFHRLTASSMGLFAIGLFGLAWWYRRSLPGWTPWATALALALVLFQGLLGGLTVTELLRFDIVTAHLGTALLFFVTLLAIGVALMPHQGMGTAGKLPWIGLIAGLLVYIQSILGALVASRWALHQCLNDSGLCVVMHSHIAGVVPPTLAVLTLAILAWRTPALHPTLRKLAKVASSLVVLQILLGVATFKLRLQVGTTNGFASGDRGCLAGNVGCLYSSGMARFANSGDR
jgi:cytochrome c oxidase assembly protein subunit 15